MPQTLLALLALALTGMLSLNQQQALIATDDDMLDTEIEMMAAGVALHTMEVLAAKSFDERSTPGEVHQYGLPSGPSEFSGGQEFGRTASEGRAFGCALAEPWTDPGCDDLDDAHSHVNDITVWQPVPFTLRNGQSVPFEVAVTVQYVHPNAFDLPVAGPTNHKLVTVRVRSEHQVQRGRYTDGVVRLERVMSYEEATAVRAYEARYGAPPS
ncbi:MAG: hypothetical protein AAFN13_08375 [Bacteroidota bacterium]